MIWQETFTVYAEDVVSIEYGENFPGREQLDLHLKVDAWNAVWSFEYASEPHFGAPDFPCSGKRGSIVDVVATLVSHQYCTAFNSDAFFLPTSCVMDCSVPGRDASEAVERWLKCDEIVVLFSKLDERDLRRNVKESGGWDDHETVTIDKIKSRCLWMWCCDCREQYQQGEIV